MAGRKAPSVQQQRQAIAAERAAVRAKAEVAVAEHWAAVEARQAIDGEASRQLVREHRAMDSVLRERAARVAAIATTTQEDDESMAATKTATKTKAAPTRKTSLSDEDVVQFIAKHLAKDPAAGIGAVTRAVRATGKSVSGGRVRDLFEQGRKAAKSGKPAVGKSQPAPKPSAKKKGRVFADRPNSAAGKKRAAAAASNGSDHPILDRVRQETGATVDAV